MFYLYVKTPNKVDVYKLQKYEDREPILKRLNLNADSYIFIGDGIYKDFKLDGKTPEQQYEILDQNLNT